MSFLEQYGGIARFGLYIIFCVWSFILFCVCCSRLGYTTHWRDEPSLNGGRPFHDPSVVELLVSTMLGEAFALMMLYQLWFRKESQWSKHWFEIGGLAVLWLLWTGGAGAASTVWPDLSWCTQYQPCVLLQALTAFAWLGWLTLTILLLGGIYFFKFRNAKWEDNHWDSWGNKTFGTGLTSSRKGPKEGGPYSTQLDDVERGAGAPPIPAKV